MATIEKWRKMWRHIASNITTVGLTALQDALERDDLTLIQGRICLPPPLDALRDRDVLAADAIGFCGLADGHATVGELEKYFHRICDLADTKANELAACRWFLSWYDETPRLQMRHELLPEVKHELSTRSMLASSNQ